MSEDNEQAKTYSQSALALIESDEEREFIPAEDVAGFVANLYQSLDSSMRHASIEAGLLTVDAVSTANIERDVEYLDEHISKRLGVPGKNALATSIAHCVEDDRKRSLLMKMISGNQFETTRNTLQDGNVSELQLKDGDISITPEFRIWAQAVDEVAVNINKAVDILVQIRDSEGSGDTFILYPVETGPL